MPCYKPLKAWRTSTPTSTGKNKIVFAKSAPTNTIESLRLPCGQCIGCRQDRANMWAIRCVQETQLHHQNSFITLTYDKEHLPWDGSLIKHHSQDFIKRLRESISPHKIRYFMCGEYGEEFKRPHYHICLFGHNWSDKDPISETEGIILYNSPSLDLLWGKGFCTIGELTFDTANYTARYIIKKINGDRAADHYETTDETTGEIINLQHEYAQASLKPGIGHAWLQKYKTDIYPSDFCIHKNKKFSNPRYYDKIMEREGYDIEGIKELRKENAIKHMENNTPARLKVREQIHQLKLRTLNRNYENAS